MAKTKGVVATLLAFLTAVEPTMALAQAVPAPPPTSTSPEPPPQPTEGRALPSTEGRVMLEGNVDPKSYILGPGDRLVVEVWGVREQSNEVEVNAEGRVSVPHAGMFAAGGEKLATLRDTIISRLHATYPHLHISVTLARPRTFLVNVVGAVARPGPYPATPLTRVSSLIPRASPLPNASTRRVEIRRKGRADKLIADIVGFSVLGDASGDPTLLDGDVVFLPVRDLEVEISGAVKRPGRYELVRERNVRELLELAGGLTSDAATSQPLRLTTRESGDRVVVHSLPQANAGQTPLHSGDAVHIARLTDLRQSVVVEGAIVGRPGQVTGIVEPDRRAGVTERPSDDRPVDPSGNAARDIALRIPFVEGDGVSDLVVKAGGLQPWADASSAYVLRPNPNGERSRIPVDLAVISSRKGQDVPIQPGDTLVVPSRRESVVVGGAVQHPGTFSYSRNLHPVDYITLAGGPTRTGVAGSAQVLKRTGVRKDIDKVNEIDPGDVISVPEATLTTAEWMTFVLLFLNLAVSAAVLVITVRHY